MSNYFNGKFCIESCNFVELISEAWSIFNGEISPIHWDTMLMWNIQIDMKMIQIFSVQVESDLVDVQRWDRARVVVRGGVT